MSFGKAYLTCFCKYISYKKLRNCLRRSDLGGLFLKTGKSLGIFLLTPIGYENLDFLREVLSLI